MVEKLKKNKGKVVKALARGQGSVFRSNKFIYAQLINDDKAETVLGYQKKFRERYKRKKSDKAKELGLFSKDGNFKK